MEEGFFAKKSSISSSSSSSSSWASRLSPLAQPFTMTGQASQSQALNYSLTNNSNPSKPLTPSTSNPLDHPNNTDSLLRKAFSDLIGLEDDQLFVSSDSALSPSASPFDGRDKSRLQYQSRPFLDEVGSSRLASLLDSSVSSSKVSAAPDVSNMALMFGSSITNSAILPHSNSFAGINNEGENVALSADGKEADRGKGLVHSNKEINVVRPVSAKSERRVTSEDVYHSLALKNSGVAAGVSTRNSAKLLNENEDDLDSPCWKGIQNSGNSFGKVSEQLVYSHHRNQPEVGPALNPEAPHFIPSHAAKGVVDYSQKIFAGDGLATSSGENERWGFNPSPLGKMKLVDPLKAEPKPPGFSHATGHRHSSGEESVILKNTNTGSVLNSSQMTRPHLVDRVSPDHNLEGFKENIPISYSSGVGSLNDFSEMLQSLSQPLSSCPNINVSMMVKAIHYLSESLVQNYANDFDSLNGHDHDMIRDIIDNLRVPIKHRAGGKAPNLGLPRSGSLDYRATTSTTIHEPLNKDFELTGSRDLVVRRELDSQSNRRWGQSYSHMPSKMQDLASSSRDVSVQGNGVVPVLRTAPKENRQIDEQFHPQALLSLWIEAQAALCTMKYENHILRMKLQMNGLSRNEQVQERFQGLSVDCSFGHVNSLGLNM